MAIRLFIDNYNKGVTMKDACAILFYKFQTRIGEIERTTDSVGVQRSVKLKINRLPMTKKNRFGHPMTFTLYKSLAPMKYLLNLYAYLNVNGLKSKNKK